VPPSVLTEKASSLRRSPGGEIRGDELAVTVAAVLRSDTVGPGTGELELEKGYIMSLILRIRLTFDSIFRSSVASIEGESFPLHDALPSERLVGSSRDRTHAACQVEEHESDVKNQES
jgi:hypothetical protein